MKLKYSLCLVADLEEFHLIAVEQNANISFFTKLMCEACGFVTGFVRLSADVAVPHKKGRHNAVHQCRGDCRKKVGTVDIVKLYEDDNLYHNERMVFADLVYEGLVPVADELDFGFQWVAMEPKGKSTQPFWLQRNTQNRLVGSVCLSNGVMGSASVQGTFEFLGRI